MTASVPFVYPVYVSEGGTRTYVIIPSRFFRGCSSPSSCSSVSVSRSCYYPCFLVPFFDHSSSVARSSDVIVFVFVMIYCSPCPMSWCMQGGFYCRVWSTVHRLPFLRTLLLILSRIRILFLIWRSGYLRRYCLLSRRRGCFRYRSMSCSNGIWCGGGYVSTQLSRELWIFLLLR